MSWDSSQVQSVGRRVVGALGVSLVAVAAALCGPAWGGAEGAFSTTDHDARGLAMGGACISLAGGDAAVHWNPAGLSRISARSVTAAHGDLIEGVPSGLTTISFAFPWGREPGTEGPHDRGDRWALGAYLSRLGLDDVAGFAAWNETALSGALARTLVGYISIGLSVRYLNVSSDIEEGSANGISADLAVSVNTTNRTRAALVVRNGLGRLNWSSGTNESLPTAADFAFSYVHEKWASTELALHFDQNGMATVSIGLEASPAPDKIVFWGGLKRHRTTSPRSVPSFGVGVPARGLMVSYGASFDENDAFGTAQRFSVRANF